jgi:hypothetical protein
LAIRRDGMMAGPSRDDGFPIGQWADCGSSTAGAVASGAAIKSGEPGEAFHREAPTAWAAGVQTGAAVAEDLIVRS